MSTKYINATEDFLYNSLIDGKIKIKDLNADYANHKKAVFRYAKVKPSILKSFASETELKFLKYIIETDKEFFIYLKPEQYSEGIASMYLYDRIKNNKNTPATFLSKNFIKQTIINLDYDTCDGEEIIYYDNDLETTTFLFSKLSAVFKIIDTVKFLQYIDVAIENVGYNCVKQNLTELLVKVFQKIAIKLVHEDKIGIYKLNSMHAEIENDILNKLNESLNEKGVVVEKVNIRKLSVSEATSKLIEIQDLEILSVRKKKKAEAEYEKLALENYAKKAEIHSQNPNYEIGLTEAEKDLALDRYIKKVKFENGLLEDLPSETILKSRIKNVDDKLEQDKDVEIEHKFTNFSFLFFVAAIIAFIVMVSAKLGTGGILICLSLITLFVGLGVVVNILHKQKVIEANTVTDDYIDYNETPGNYTKEDSNND